MISCEHCEIFKNLYFKGHLWTTTSELYWFKVKEIIEKTETYSETIIGNVFRDDNRRRIQNPVKHLKWNFLQKQLTVFNRWLFLQNTFIGLWRCLDKTKQNPGVLSFISQKNRTIISANIFSNSILSSCYYVAIRH